MKRAYADTPEGQVHYVTEGSGEPIVLLHETPTSWASFARLIPLLAQNYRVIAMDTLGFGDSDPPPWEYEIEKCADSVVHFLDSLGITKTNLAGERTGATMALEVAAGWPERVQKLVLAGLPYWRDTERQARLEREEAGNTGAYEEDGSHCSRTWQFAVTRREQGAGKGNISEQDLEFIRAYTLGALKAGQRYKGMHLAVYGYDPKPRLSLVQALTLVLNGLTDIGASPYTVRSQEVQALIPGSSLGLGDGGDAQVINLKTDQVAETIRQFLNTSKS